MLWAWKHFQACYKCDLLPNITHLELQTAEFGQNFAKRANFFVFGLMVFSFYHLLGHHIRFHFVRITFSSDSYCDLQHISKVYLFRNTHPLYYYHNMRQFCCNWVRSWPKLCGFVASSLPQILEYFLGMGEQLLACWLKKRNEKKISLSHA